MNYRALSDLFEISENRRNSYFYEVGVQMVEIYNEQVRDLLVDDGPQKRYPLCMSVSFLLRNKHNFPQDWLVLLASFSILYVADDMPIIVFM